MADLIDRDAVFNTMAKASIGGMITDSINAIPAVNRWIPCAERMPEFDKDVLVYAIRKDGLGDAVTTITQYINYMWFGHKIDTEPYWKDAWQYFHSDYEITHWMPLPEPPKDGDVP